MKKAFKHLLILTCLVINVVSCEQNGIEEIINVTNEKSKTISFKYCGKSYSSTYQIKDGSIIYSNKETQKIQEELFTKPNLAILIDAKDNLEYFDNYEKLQDAINTTWNPTPAVTGTTIGAKITACFHINVGFKGGGQSFVIYPEQGQVWVSDMSKIALDSNGILNKVSSVQLLMDVYDNMGYNGFITLWDQKAFSWFSITWTVSSGDQTRKIKNLGEFSRGGLPPLTPVGTWNDAAQSLKVGYISLY